jgi:hypothetical protein
MLIRNQSINVGDVVELRGARGSELRVRAPDGLVVVIPAASGRASVWVPQAGEWAYEWVPDGATGTLTVAEAPDEDNTEPESVPVAVDVFAARIEAA